MRYQSCFLLLMAGAVPIGGLVRNAGAATVMVQGTAASTGTLSVKLAPQPVFVQVGTIGGAQGRTVRLPVSIQSNESPSVALTTDLYLGEGFSFGPCRLDTTATKDIATSQLPGNGLRVAIQSPLNNDPIPDGVVYSCEVSIDATVLPGTYAVALDNPLAYKPGGTDTWPTSGSNGEITVSPASRPCAGDCTGSGSVRISDLITGVSIALGARSLSACPSLDTNVSGMVEINELIVAVNNALRGCEP